MSAETRINPAWSLVSVLTSATLAIAIFWLASLARSGSLGAPLSLETLLLASIGVALVLPAARARVDSLVSRLTSRGRATPYESLTALVPPPGTPASLADTLRSASSAIAHAIDAEGVMVSSGDGARTLSTGSLGEVPAWRGAISFGGTVFADVEVYREGELSVEERSLLGDICAMVGLVANHAAVAAELEARAREINDAVELLERNRRLLVVAEQEHRSDVAALVVDQVKPLFDELRASIEADDLDRAATAAEDMIDFLRSVSTKVLEGSND